MAPQGRKTGFTLIEVMTIVAIIGVMSALALSVVGRRLGDQRAKAAVRSLANLFQLARTEAIRTGVNHVVFVQLDPADDPLLDKAGTPVAALLIADADADGIPDAGEYKASVPFDATGSLSWGSSFAAVGSHTAPNDNTGGTFPATDPNFACCTFQDPGGNDARAVVFLPDGLPRAFSTGPFAMGTIGGGGGAVYVTSGTRDYAVVLAPLGSARVHAWNRGATAWTD
jgi:prepilin-type N-terminal cleavage/methylation domain-containing protein